MDTKTEVTEEAPFSEVISHTKRQSFSQYIKMKLNSDAAMYNKLSETEIKEEIVDSDFSPQNDCQCFSKNLVMKVKQCHNDYEMETKTIMNEMSVDSDFRSQNKRQFCSEVPAVTDNPCNKDSEPQNKIEIKEEPWWLETTSTEALCVGDVTKDWMDESFPSTKSIRIYREEVPTDKSASFSDENSGNDARFNMPMDSEKAKNYI